MSENENYKDTEEPFGIPIGSGGIPMGSGFAMRLSTYKDTIPEKKKSKKKQLMEIMDGCKVDLDHIINDLSWVTDDMYGLELEPCEMVGLLKVMESKLRVIRDTLEGK